MKDASEKSVIFWSDPAFKNPTKERLLSQWNGFLILILLTFFLAWQCWRSIDSSLSLRIHVACVVFSTVPWKANSNPQRPDEWLFCRLNASWASNCKTVYNILTLHALHHMPFCVNSCHCSRDSSASPLLLCVHVLLPLNILADCPRPHSEAGFSEPLIFPM